MRAAASRLGLATATLGIVLCSAQQAAAQLNEHCTVSVLNRTVRVNPDGSWQLRNIPARFGRVKARATCVQDGVTRFGESDLFTVPRNGSITLPIIILGPVSPIPASVAVSPANASLTAAGESLQLTVTATYPSGATSDVTAADTGTNYTTSNPAIATISADGLVTAVASGTALIQATNDGTAGIAAVVVTLSSSDTDGDGIADDVELANGLDPNNRTDAQEDPDRDGLTNAQELSIGTDLRKADTDEDGLTDGEEGPLGTSPLLRDTDGDGIGDGLERQAGTDPLDPGSFDLAAALSSIVVTPPNFALNISSLGADVFQALRVTGRLRDGATIDLTARGTAYESSNLAICHFGESSGLVFAGSVGVCVITVSSAGFSATSTGTIRNFTPTTLSFVDIPGFANNVDVLGNFAYVAAGPAGLQVVDVSDHLAPRVAASVDTPGDAKNVQVAGTRAYVADGPGGLRIVDIANPLAPLLLGAVQVPDADARDVAVSGNLAFVADGTAGLQIIDVTNRTDPLLIRSFAVDGIPSGVEIAGNLALVAAGWSGVQIVDVSDPAQPVFVGTAYVSGAQDVVAAGSIAYVAGDSGLQVVDFSSPAESAVIGSAFGLALADVAVSGDLALGAEGAPYGGGVTIVDVAVPAAPVQRASLDFTTVRYDLPNGIAVDGSYVYVTAPARPDYGPGQPTRLHIGQYRAIEDAAGIPPTVTIVSPGAGVSIVEGETIPVAVAATDDVLVASVSVVVDGVVVATDTTAPYQFSATAPIDATSLIIGATAVDLAGNTGVAPNVQVTVTVNPLTTVIGRVLMRGEAVQPVAGAQVQALGQTGTTGADGTFSIGGVRTFRAAMLVNATLSTGGVVLIGVSAPTPPVRGGTTDVGDIVVVESAFEANLGTRLTACINACSVSSGPLPFAFPFYGVPYQEVFVNSWGNLTLGGPEADSLGFFSEPQYMETVSVFLGGRPRIAAFWDDVTTFGGGTAAGVYLNKTLPDRVVVTWFGLLEWNSIPGANTFQVTLFSDGRIQMAYHTISSLDAIVGVSPGGLPLDSPRARAVDFSASPTVIGGTGEAIYEQFEVPVPRGHTDESATRNNPYDLGSGFITFAPNAAGGYDTFVVRDTFAPMCTVTFPVHGSTLFEGEPIIVTATASDSLGVRQVTFTSSDGSLSRIDTIAPYSTSFVVPVGVSQIIFTAAPLDAAGNTGSCSSTVIVIPGPPPSVTIVSPPAGTALVAGSTIPVTVRATSRLPVSRVDAAVNGVALSSTTEEPHEFLLTVPMGLTSLTVRASAFDSVGSAGTSGDIVFSIAPDPLTTVQGRVVDGPDAPVDDARVVAELHGVSAEVFNFNTTLSELPDLTGRPPDLVTTVSALNLRNPEFGLGINPFGFGTAPSRVVRFTANLQVPYPSRWVFKLGVNQGGLLIVNGVPIVSLTGSTAQFREATGQPITAAGTVPIQILTFDNGNLEVQLSMTQDGSGDPPRAIATSEMTPALESYHTTSGPAGTFSMANVPTTLGAVGASATFTSQSGSALAGTAMPVAPLAGGITDVGEIRLLASSSIFVSDAFASGVIRVDPVSGTQQLIAAGGAARGARGIAVLRSGLIALAVSPPFLISPPGVVLVDPSLPFDRNQTVLSSGGLFQDPAGLAVEASGTILVTDSGRLIRIDPSLPSPNNQTLLASGLPFAVPSNLAVEANGTIVVANPLQGGGLIRVDPVTGAQTPVAGTSTCPRAVTVDAGGDLLFTGAPGTVCGGASLYRLSPGGIRTTVTAGMHLVMPYSVVVGATGTIFVSDDGSGVMRVDQDTGAQTVISSGGLITEPVGVAVSPAR